MKFLTILWLVLVPILAPTVSGQPGTGRLHGLVRDQNHALVADATVTITAPDGKEHRLRTGKDGEFSVVLPVGEYVVKVDRLGFQQHTSRATVAPTRSTNVTIDLDIAVVVNSVVVEKDPPVSTDPDNNASAVLLKKDELKALPDDPTELEAALRALAGPGSGPDGGELLIDGFSGGKLPKKETIREVRINQNPFSSEYDRPGFGRIEIFTKPGTEDWHGELWGEFADESLNSRNPFSPDRPPYQLRNVNGQISGPIIKGRVSFFTELERETIDNNLLVNAVVLDPITLTPKPFQQSFVTRSTNWDFGQRVDAQLSRDHTLVARFSRETFTSPHTAFGGFELPSTGWASANREWFIRLTETAVLSPAVINETRFQFFRINEEQNAVDKGPTIRVLEAFTSGGSVGLSINRQARHEFTNITSIVTGRHVIRTGLRVRKQVIDDTSASNRTGTFTFITLDQYRNTLLNVPGAYPAQLSIAGGEPRAVITRWDVGAFVQDDVRWNTNLTLSFGLRYERQNQISSTFDLAPRLALAYAPGDGKNPPKTVLRAGFGIFYDRFNATQGLQVIRLNGIDRQQFLVTDSAILDAIVFTASGVTNIPNVSTLAAFQQPQVTRVIDSRLRSPYTEQTAVSIERRLPRDTTISLSYINSRVHRMLRSRNINAPKNGVRPDLAQGNVYQYESTGGMVQHMTTANFRAKPSRHLSLFGNYTLGWAKSDTDGAGTFPADQYDLRNEYGRSSFDSRHRISFGGDLQGPLGVSFSPFIRTSSGSPFNITTGTDLNGDGLFTDRPSFATADETGAVVTRFGTFDPTPEPGDVIIPRNYGSSPGFVTLNLNLSKTFVIGVHPKTADDDEEQEGKFKLELAMRILNILNHTNLGRPVGNLRSTLFGQSTSTAGGVVGNRRIFLEANFSF